MAKTRLGADCGSDHELLIANSDLEKVGKTTRPFMYDLNQISYDYYTLEVRNRFKGLHLINRMREELWLWVRNIVQEAPRDQDHPQEKEVQKGKMVV